MQKMRMLFALFITLPLILSLSLEPGYAETNKIENIMGEVFEKLKSFNSKTDEEKDKMIKELDSSILDLNKEIKNYISEKKEKPYGKIIDLMRKMHVMNHYLKNRVCNQGDENCNNEKKRLMNKFISPFFTPFLNTVYSLNTREESNTKSDNNIHHRQE